MAMSTFGPWLRAAIGITLVIGLLNCGASGDQPVAGGAAGNLDECGPQCIARVTSEDSLTRELAIRHLWRAGPQALDALVSALSRDDRHIRQGAALALGQLMGVAQALCPTKAKDEILEAAQAALPCLEEIVSDTTVEPSLRRLALDSYAAIRLKKKADVTSYLAQMMKDKHENVRASASSWLWVLGPDSVPCARRLLASPEPGVRRDAVRLLGRFGLKAQRTAPDLIPLLSDDDATVRLATALALDRLNVHLETAVPPLVRALQNHGNVADSTNVVDAARALGRIGSPAIKPLLAVLLDSGEKRTARHFAALCLAHIGRPAVYELKDALDHDDLEVRRLAAAALSTMGADGLAAHWALTEALGDKDPAVRRNCACALGSIGLPDRSTVHRLARLVAEDPEPTVREASARAVGYIRLGLQEDTRRLTEALNDHEPDVREAATFALGCVRGRVEARVAALLKALQDDSAAVRETAARALGSVGRRCDQDARQAVRAALKNAIDDIHYDVKQAAGNALSAIDWPAEPPASRALSEEVWRALDTGQIKGAMAILAADDPEVIRLLQMVLKHWSARFNPAILERALYLIEEADEAAHWAAPGLAGLVPFEERYEGDTNVVEALAKVGTAARVATLDCLWITKQGTGHRVRFAVDALAKMWQAEEFLVDLMGIALTHPNVDVRVLAAKRLSESCPWPTRAAHLLQERLNDEFHEQWFDPYIRHELWWDWQVTEKRLKQEIRKARERYREAILDALEACREEAEKAGN